ncbi:TRAP transporter large permease [Desulfoscipio gibsoniae]|uniref:TRAP transporter, DctM subunit n=1 Tax=Desulfoscipio gibsoniae DSM 7213 TaxID=767817 RepID=R4KI94_9FIRM|nr:TRAP transporter large permease [Desulfoscipio gibsoniae]AGL00250.1 TRAP transporter, DctM subunit [Desulfoscipio gibsoniae DSM 7213]
METIFLISIVLMLVTLFIGTPVAIALGVSGLVGLYAVFGENSLIIGAKVFTDTLNDFILLAIPLYIIMGVILARGGVGKKLFRLFDAFLRHIPGGIGIATILTCAVLAAMCGTSVAIAAMVGSFAFTDLQKYGYSLPLSLGIVGAGGALGILIPPSVPMIVYGAFSGESVGKLLSAGVIPGIVTVILFTIYVAFAYIRQKGVKVAKAASWRERWEAFMDGIWALLVPFGIVVPLYTGIATPTETAAVGILWAFIVCMGVYKTIKWRDIIHILKEGSSSSVMVMFIICGAMLLGNAATQIGLSHMLTEIFAGSMSGWVFIPISLLTLLVLGMFLEGASIMLITLPIYLPVLIMYQFDLIWYAIIMVMAIEIALLSPPVGLNLFAIHGVAKSLGLPSTQGIVIQGCWPFMVIYLLSMIFVMAIPQIALLLPGRM